MKNILNYLLLLCSMCMFTLGCDTYDIEPTKVGREYQSTGLLNLYAGQTGFCWTHQGCRNLLCRYLW